MSILSGFSRFKRYRKTSDGYKLSSEWTSSDTVEMNDGNTAETNLGAIQGITSSLATDNSNYALSSSGGKDLQDQITELNSNKGNLGLTKLWSNSNPNSLFSEQNVTLSSNDYDFLIVEFAKVNSEPNKRFTKIVFKGYSTVLQISLFWSISNTDTVSLWIRNFEYVNDTTYTIGACKRCYNNTSSTTNNSSIIPTTIYAGKLV